MENNVNIKAVVESTLIILDEKKETREHLTDKQISTALKPFIGNVKCRRKEILHKLDLRMLYTITRKLIESHIEFKTININMLVNNSLIFNLTDDLLRFPENINDKLLLGVMEHKSFLGIK